MNKESELEKLALKEYMLGPPDFRDCFKAGALALLEFAKANATDCIFGHSEKLGSVGIGNIGKGIMVPLSKLQEFCHGKK